MEATATVRFRANSFDRATTEAIGRIEARGGAITYAALAEEMGCTARAAHARVRRLRAEGGWSGEVVLAVGGPKPRPKAQPTARPWDPARDRADRAKATADAIRAIDEAGERLTAIALMARLGVTRSVAESRMAEFRAATSEVRRLLVQPAYDPKSEDDLDDRDRRMLAEARRQAEGGGGVVAPKLVGRAVRTQVNYERVRRLRTLGLWPWPTPADLKDGERIDPARVAVQLAKAYKGMGDGRAEVDDPPVGLPPSNGRPASGPPPLRLVTRGYFRDWQVRTGRRPAPAPAREAGVPHNEMYRAPTPYERRLARITIDGRSRGY